jgi:hypothetical protein
MAKKELFIKRVYEIINELKAPLIDERVYYKALINESSHPTVVYFRFEDDESILRGFLGLAEYFHTIILKKKEKFYISTPKLLFSLECS